VRKDIKVAVAFGGQSRERDISILTGQAIVSGLRQGGFSNVQGIDTKANPKFYEDNWDIVFIALHGPGGEDGTLQKELEKRRIPFTGSGSKSSKLAMSKYESKLAFEKHGIPTLPFFYTKDMRDTRSIQDKIKTHLTYPVIAKPDKEGSSIGLEIIRHDDQLPAAIARLCDLTDMVLWENYIEGGIDLTVGILNQKALPVIEIRPLQGWYDYQAKYTKGMTEYHCPARIGDAFTKKVQALALKAFEVLGCRSWGRVDFLHQGEALYCLEVNTVPGMTPTSLVPMAAAELDIDFNQLVRAILTDAVV